MISLFRNRFTELFALVGQAGLLCFLGSISVSAQTNKFDSLQVGGTAPSTWTSNGSDIFLNTGVPNSGIHFRPNGDGASNGGYELFGSGLHKFYDASGNAQVVFANDFVGIGPGNFSPGSVLDIRFPLNPATDNGGGGSVLRVSTTSAIAADTGGGVGLGGLADSSGQETFFGQIAGRKSVAASGNYSGYLQFSTNSAGGTMFERMRITESGNVGIGSSAPATALHIWRQSVNAPVISKVENATTGPTTQARVDLATGTPNGYAIMNLQDNQGAPYFQFTVGPAVVATYYDAPQHIFRRSDGTEWLRIVNGNVGIGTTTPTQKLSVAGTVRAKEVVVDTDWSDYVFAEDYRLAPLSEVEQKIKADKHLPGMPSAQEVAEKGISVGQIEAKLLAKIEEITLHQIALEKENNALRARVAKLESAR